jgi:serine/threonine-protein kinase
VQPTVTSPQERKPAGPAPTGGTDTASVSRTSSDSIDEARFTPGTMLSDRYRIVGLLGRGGMGEVYRADDLKLRQPVALKFLPTALASDPRRLDRFLHEVRVARQVSHPNVCRVYDIAEAEGQHFISMEYVDGEDLATMLRRLGKPSKGKSLQVARQLCAGLAAAHDKGVLHRDLKPHNVMIDGRGVVRITDFGLAGFVEDFVGREVLAGTPAYMAPEQLAGREVSVKSDIYSLGLVLFELFTGRRAFEGKSRPEVQQSRTNVPTTMTSVSDEVDPAVERIVLRCLAPEPAARPSSALAVAASLPGGDPLAAALAAGETPDPALVAAAGDVGGLRPAVAVPCFVAVLIGLGATVALENKLVHLVPLPKTPDALADRAAEMIANLGHTEPVVDRAYGFTPNWEYIEHLEEHDKSPDRWQALSRPRPPGMLFWYRQSPRLLEPYSAFFNVQPWDPPWTASGMAGVQLDSEGRLRALTVVPPQRVEPSTKPPGEDTDWAALFEQAELDFAAFKPVPPTWAPVMYCDERGAWEGRFEERPDVPIRVEAGAFHGKPTYFQLIGPWTKPDRMEEDRTSGQTGADIAIITLLAGVVGAAVLLARRNLRMRRGDRTGANRLAVVFFSVTILSWLLTGTHVRDIFPEFFRLVTQIGIALVLTATLWLLYIGLEPYVRRRWPQVLIAWSRLLAGRFRDPLIGRDIMIGMLLTTAMALTRLLRRGVLEWMGAPPDPPGWSRMDVLLGGRFVVGAILSIGDIWFVLFVLFALFLARQALRRETLAVVAVLIVFSIPDMIMDEHGYGLPLRIAAAILEMLPPLLVLVALIRFGLLTVIVGMLTGSLVRSFPMTFDLSASYAGPSMLALAVLVALAAFGFHSSLAGRPLWRDELTEG